MIDDGKLLYISIYFIFTIILQFIMCYLCKGSIGLLIIIIISLFIVIYLISYTTELDFIINNVEPTVS